MSRTSLIAVFLAALVAMSGSVPSADARSKNARQAQIEDCGDTAILPDSTNIAEVRQTTLCLLNVERADRGRSPLRSNVSLRSVATRYSQQMVDEGFFGHVSPGGSTLSSRINSTSYLRGSRSWNIGENLAWGTGNLATPAAIVRSWMNSSGHRANLLSSRFRDIGVGVVLGAPNHRPGGATYTTNFGRR